MTSTAPFTFIEDKVAIGGLLAYGEDLSAFTFRMNVAWELCGDMDSPLDTSRFKPIDASRHGAIHNARLNDDDNIEPQAEEILRAAALVSEAIENGHTVLVTCAAGRNRSGVVLAEALIQLGRDTEAVISNIQSKRLHALSNNTFVEWLRRDRPSYEWAQQWRDFLKTRPDLVVTTGGHCWFGFCNMLFIREFTRPAEKQEEKRGYMHDWDVFLKRFGDRKLKEGGLNRIWSIALDGGKPTPAEYGEEFAREFIEGYSGKPAPPVTKSDAGTQRRFFRVSKAERIRMLVELGALPSNCGKTTHSVELVALSRLRATVTLEPLEVLMDALDAKEKG
jgi:hypothetical protein